MIIRRRHTANFTTIGNALFNDERLQADEVGIIGYLLSRPHDWEVRRPQLARRFHYGRDAIKRVIANGMRYGWIVAQKTRLSDGRFHTIYEVRDEPGPELSDDEIRNALSLGSSEAGEPDHEGEDGQGPDTGDPPPPDPATPYPATGQPATGNPYVASKKEATKYGFTKDESTKGARAFADVKAKWPSEHVLSIVACEGVWAAFTDAMREAAYNGIPAYLGDCQAQGRKVCDLSTYLKERRWERFAQRSSQAFFHVRPRTPQAFRWREYLQRVEPDKLRGFDLCMDRSGWTAPSEWPPAMPAQTQLETTEQERG